jgi:hypothetical protein
MAFGFLVGHLLDQVYISLAFTLACGRLSAARRNPEVWHISSAQLAQ